MNFLAGPVAGDAPTMLFPIAPVQGETLVGYVMRTVEWNHLGRFGGALKVLGLSCQHTRNPLGELSDGLKEFHLALGIDAEALATLWGAEPMLAGRRRLGGVWLRPGLIASAVRRLPPSVRDRQSDQAIWMVRHLGFCPSTWELLTEVCPRRWCGRPLWWWGAAAIDQCWHCGGRLGEVKRRAKVSKADRQSLRWVADLFENREDVVQGAITKIPPLFSVADATDAYEFVVGLARMFQDLWSLPAQIPTRDAVRTTATAARYILDFPQSHWDFERAKADGDRPSFRARLRLLRDHNPIASVRINAGIALDFGRERTRIRVPAIPDTSLLSLRNAARALQVELCVVNDLVAHKFLNAVPAEGRSKRKAASFYRKQIAALQKRFSNKLSWGDFSRSTGLPKAALGQLLDAGVLRPSNDGAVRLVYGDQHLDRTSAESFLRQLMEKASEPREGWVALRDVMQGVGGRQKPWSRILTAAIKGEIPGGVGYPQGGRLDAISIHPMTAYRLVMGGPGAASPFAHLQSPHSKYHSCKLGVAEAAAHLNCTAQDISFLRTRGFLQSVSVPPEHASYRRQDVDELGVTYISTREMAARLGLKPKDLWQGFDLIGAETTIGQGFHVRAVIEPKLQALIVAGLSALDG